MPTKGPELKRFTVSPTEEGQRLDRVVASRLGLPRAVVRGLFAAGKVRSSGRPARATTRARAGTAVEVELPSPEPPASPIPILYEDEELIVIDKPAGLSVHAPGVGRATPSVVGALLLQGKELAGGPPERPGVVHRLDAATSGVMVLAKGERAWRDLVDQFRSRTVEKEYLALVEGEVEVEEGRVVGRIGRDPSAPWRMRVARGGKGAETEFTLLFRRDGRSLLLVRPRTGRTHQIRVHLAAIGHPVVGDPLYGREGRRLMLHAWRLRLRHPKTREPLEFVAPPPPEFSGWLAATGNKRRPGN